MIDLKAIFDDDAAPVAVVMQAPVPEGGSHDNGLGDPEPDLFAAWVQRPDFRGRLRWEAPDVPEADRWWARCGFDDLPELSFGRRSDGADAMNSTTRALERQAIRAPHHRSPWPPAHLALPDSIEAIEAGRPRPQQQGELFDVRIKGATSSVSSKSSRQSHLQPAA
jgi:hypothetical protein